MKITKHLPFLLLLLLLLAACLPQPAVPTATPSVPPPTMTPPPTPTPVYQRPLLLAHYMPWYQTPAVSGYWGYHWTMNHFNPNKTDANGRREIASHFYPLTGPYDSQDDAILEYQVLLMKLSGVDGVIVDWYGMDDFWDYAVLNRSTHKLFNYIQKAGLQFAICYEDQTIRHMVENGHLAEKDIYTHAQEVMQYLQANWFEKDVYLKVGGRPVLFIFGPSYFVNSTDWDNIFSVLPQQPVFVTLNDQAEPIAATGYPWPPMSASVNGVLSSGALNNYLASFYQKTAKHDLRVASAFPGFYDIYKEAGVGAGYGYLDDLQGETFRQTLQAALESHPNMVQLVTWNDYGEGTIIEPTVEFGYRYLEMVQETRRSTDPLFLYTSQDLALPLKLFELRQKQDDATKAQLDEAFEALLAGDVKTARTMLEKLGP